MRTRKIWAVTVLCLTVLLFFAGFGLSPANVAFAAVPDSYTSYVSSLDSNTSEWYFGENYLNLDAVLATVNGWRSNPSFDWDALASDPIVIAVIDSGIGHAYKSDGNGGEVIASKTEYYKTAGYTYKMNPIFDDVILKDADGNYVGTSTVDFNYVKKTAINVPRDLTRTDLAYMLADNTDDNHGTHVTGTVALLIHKLGLEDYVKIMPIKANSAVKESNGKRYATYDYSDVEEAVIFAVDNGADVINLSLTASGSGFSFSDYYSRVVFVAAAGNDGSYTPLGYPAADSGVVGVMNYNSSSNGAVRWINSNYGSYYDVAAPGVNIISTIDGKDGYGKLTGTSMASPIVSFSAALLTLRYRGIEIETGIEISPLMVRKMLSISASETNDVYKLPTLNLHALVTADFLYDERYEGDVYVQPSGIAAYSLSPIEQIIGNLSEVKMKAKFTPTNSKTDDTITWWYECGGEKTELGTGEEITFMPPSAVGTYAVYCKLTDKITGTDTFVCSVNDAFVFTIRYNVLTEDNSDLLFDGNAYEAMTLNVDSELKLSIRGIEDVDPSKCAVAWYVNDERVSTDINLSYSFKEAGTYTVYATVNGVKTGDDVTVTVSAPSENIGKLTAEQIACIIAGATILVFAATALIVKFTVKRKSKAE